VLLITPPLYISEQTANKLKAMLKIETEVIEHLYKSGNKAKLMNIHMVPKLPSTFPERLFIAIAGWD